MSAPLLSAEGVCKSYAGVRAVQDMHLRVHGGELVALIGPNGSGKSTLFDCITGFQKSDAGTVHFDGRDVSDWKPHRLARCGLRRTFQQLRVFPGLSVGDNLLAAGQAALGFGFVTEIIGGARVRSHVAQMRARCMELLASLRLDPVQAKPASVLSYGQKKLLEFGMAMMGKPRLLMLDEPMAGVNPTVIEDLKHLLLQARAEGAAVLMVEHNLKLILEVSDRVYVMDQGRLLAEGTPAAVAADERVLQAYLGRSRMGAHAID